MEVGSSTLPGTTRVQNCSKGGLAQLARALAWHARGHRFDSDILHVALYARAIFDKLIKQKKKRHETRLIRSTAEVCLPHSFFLDVGRRRESEKGRTEDALALTSDEGRDKLRKAAVRRKWPLTRGCPNGKTRQAEGLSHLCEVGERRELKHLSTGRKRK